ncbi:hypothetical protein FOQG_19259 [Fusarium oxysporum f. sp. raphani 54005]|uniref:Uncharacterized protein n=1 Tax=Fusarium oxysporum f. sp. raphani 54005 TaxID=1089458 RepID=X0BAX9_FUSOX|nr:hypothetical protein FOQG_19259 [Fusarium oxysporum f. sp. raphani 54005]
MQPRLARSGTVAPDYLYCNSPNGTRRSPMMNSLRPVCTT